MPSVHPYFGLICFPILTKIGSLEISYFLSTVDNSINLYLPGFKSFVYSPFSSVSITLYLTPLISSSLPTILPLESYAIPSEASSFTSYIANLVFGNLSPVFASVFIIVNSGLFSTPIL